MSDNVSVNPGTTTPIATDDVAGVQFQKIKVNLGADGVDGSLWDGKVAVTAGTVASGSIVVTVGTITTMPNIPGGTITSVAEVANLAKGTVTRLEGGTVNLVTAVSNLTNGSIVVTTGTLASIPNIPGGTLGLVTAVTEVGNLAKGTITRLEGGTVTRVSTIGTLEVGTIAALPNLPQGSINVTAGTITAGSIVVTNGTMKLDGRTSRNVLPYGTFFGGTAAGYATLVGSAAVGVGTSIWVNTIDISNPAGDVLCVVGFGTALQGTSILARGVFGTTTGKGISKSFPLAVNAGMTNQDLVAYIGAAGTVNFNVSYFISA